MIANAREQKLDGTASLGAEICEIVRPALETLHRAHRELAREEPEEVIDVAVLVGIDPNDVLECFTGRKDVDPWPASQRGAFSLRTTFMEPAQGCPETRRAGSQAVQPKAPRRADCGAVAQSGAGQTLRET